MGDPEAFFEKFKDRHLVSREAVETVFILEGYGEDGTDAMMRRIQLVAEMAPTEIIKKVSMLKLYTGEPNTSDVGKMVAIRERTISGTLTDILDLKKNDGYVLAIDGKMYKAHGEDLIIVNEPSLKMENEPEADPYPEGMDRVDSIALAGECVIVNQVNGISYCSHLSHENSQGDNILSLRRWEDKPEVIQVGLGPVNMNWIKQIEAIHTLPDGLKCTHVEFKNGAHICSNTRHTTLGNIDSPSLREE